MFSEQDIERARPEAFDFVFGNLPPAKRAEFNRHLAGCRHCQAVIEEYSEIGGIIQQLPPHAGPPADLEDRTVAAMIAALAERRAATGRRPDTEDQAVTRLYPKPERQPAPEPQTRVRPVPQFQPPAENETGLRPSPAGPPAAAEPQARPLVTRLPVWRRPRARLAAMAAAAAAIIIAALVVIPNLGGGRLNPAQATAAVPLYATTAARVMGDGAATGRATAHQAGPSWTFQM